MIFSSVNTLWANSTYTTGSIVIVDKAKKNLVLFRNGAQLAEFPAAFGIDPDSDKYKTRDGATPEGVYYIQYKKQQSRFHRFLGLSYPNLSNAARGLAGGVISRSEYGKLFHSTMKWGRISCDTGLGCGIGIHGGGVFRFFGKTRETNWTEGCIALDDPDIERVFNLCGIGNPVIIFNSRRNFCGVIRPFTYPKDVGKDGVPVSHNGVYTYQIEMLTFLGRMMVTLEEGKDYGRSISVTVSTDGPEKVVLIELVDRNADGYISLMDRLMGPMADGKSPELIYAQLKAAVVDTLSKGEIFVLNPSR